MKVPEDGEVVQFPERELDFDNDTLRGETVSYTHLTLPTIYSV